MQTFSLSDSDYDAIKRYVATHHIALLVLDLNGVLDDYNARKIDALRDVLGLENERHLPELLLAIERAYMTDRSATIEQSFEQFFGARGLQITDDQRNKLAHFKVASQLTREARTFLDSLEIPFVIYTSLSREQAEKALGPSQYDLFTRDQYQEMKPSIANLTAIMTRYNVTPQETCVVGDGLIDDLMPASLVGMHTILVSPHAELLVRPSAEG